MKEGDRRKILDLYAKGTSCRTIAERMNYAESTVRREITAWRKYNCKPAEIDEGKVFALAYGGWTIRDIAGECRCTEAQAQAIIRERIKTWARQ